jgi:hypothetical protein
MRITDDRYTRDRYRLDLAMRMIRHEARTGTIKRWTGLSDDRIRKLYRTYLECEPSLALKRHRGKPPRQAGYFLRNADMRRQAAHLAGLYAQLGLLPAGPSERRDAVRSVHAGELFCCIYETYQSSERPARISFEHACYLLQALERRAELGLGECPCCRALVLVDALKLRARRCSFCETDPLIVLRRAPFETGNASTH